MRAPSLIETPNREECRAMLAGAALAALLVCAILPAIWRLCLAVGG